MAIRVPKNKIKAGLYTSGGEFLIAKTQQRYQGYYYEINDKFYIGKEYKDNSPELIKANSDKVNKLLSNPFTYIYGIISGVKISTNKITSIPTSTNPDLIDAKVKFYCQKVNQNPIVIKEIDEDTYKSLQTNPLYKTTYIGIYNNKNQTPENAEKQMPGIIAFLGL